MVNSNFVSPHDRYVNLMSDEGFKRIFGSPANKDILIALLTAIIPELRIRDLTYIDKDKSGEWDKAKKSAFDVMVQTEGGQKVIVEVQVKPQKDFPDRTLYYVSHCILEQHKEADSEYLLAPIYCVSILNFELKHDRPEERIKWNYSLRENANGELMTDAVHFTFVELGKFNKTEKELATLEDSLYFCLQRMNSLKDRPKSLQHDIIKRLFKTAEIAAMNVQEQTEYFNNMTTERDIINQIAYAKEQGIDEGVMKTAKAMKDKKYPLNDIIDCTGLTEEQVEAL